MSFLKKILYCCQNKLFEEEGDAIIEEVYYHQENNSSAEKLQKIESGGMVSREVLEGLAQKQRKYRKAMKIKGSKKARYKSPKNRPSPLQPIHEEEKESESFAPGSASIKDSKLAAFGFIKPPEKAMEPVEECLESQEKADQSPAENKKESSQDVMMENFKSISEKKVPIEEEKKAKATRSNSFPAKIDSATCKKSDKVPESQETFVYNNLFSKSY